MKTTELSILKEDLNDNKVFYQYSNTCYLHKRIYILSNMQFSNLT